MHTDGKILIADSDRKTRDLVSAFLTYQGYDIVHHEDTVSIIDNIQKQRIGIVIAELTYLQAIAPDFLDKARKFVPLLVLISYGGKDEKSPFRPSDEGVFHLPKPLNLDELESLVMRASEYQAMRLHEASNDAPRNPQMLCSTIIGKSAPMQSLFDMIEKVAASSATVLIQGESGTGKELAARAIHQLSGRNTRNFVPVNCAAIPDDLLESELFGHVKGSFTGAYANRAGRFEMADKGTLFLDEIGDMKASLQVKLLRVLQNREF